MCWRWLWDSGSWETKTFVFNKCCAEEVDLKVRAYVLNILTIDRGKSNGTRVYQSLNSISFRSYSSIPSIPQTPRAPLTRLCTATPFTPTPPSPISPPHPPPTRKQADTTPSPPLPLQPSTSDSAWCHWCPPNSYTRRHIARSTRRPGASKRPTPLRTATRARGARA